MIIAVEGLNAAGKSTYIKKHYNNYNYTIIHAPDYETESGRIIQRHLLNQETVHSAELLENLFRQNRLEIYRNRIIPAL